MRLIRYGIVVLAVASAGSCAVPRPTAPGPVVPPPKVQVLQEAGPGHGPGLIDVFDHGAVGDGVHDDAAALARAMAAAIARGTPSVHVPRPIWLKSHFRQGEFPGLSARAEVTFVVPRGGGFHVGAAGLDLDLVGDLLAGPYQVFFGDVSRSRGLRLFPSGSVRPEWFGAQGDGQTDDTAAITQAIRHTSGEVLFRPVTYLVSGSTGSDLFGFQAKRMTGQRFGAAGGTVIRVASGSGHLGSVFRALTSKVMLRDILIDANFRAAHGVLLDRAHGSTIENVAVEHATSHGFHSKGAMSCAWTNVSATFNGGDGVRLDDSNASRLTGVFTTRNGGYGISIRSTLPESGGASAGVTLVAPDVEADGAGGILVSGTCSVSSILNAWVEAGATGDALSIVGAKHVTVFGGRFTGIGSGANRAIRIGSGSTGIGLFGARVRAGQGSSSYEAIEVEAGATSVTVLDVLLMVQIPGAVATPVPVTGPAASQVWTGRGSSQPTSTATSVEALRADFNELLSRLRAAGLLAPGPGGAR